MDVKLVLSVLQKTIDFETKLAQKFPIVKKVSSSPRPSFLLDLSIYDYVLSDRADRNSPRARDSRRFTS